MSDSTSPAPVGVVVGVVVGLLVLAAISAVAIHIILEKRQQDMRKALEQQLLRYTTVPFDARRDISIGETVDGSGIPKVRSLSNNIVMLAYGHQLSSPAAAEQRLFFQAHSMPGYVAEIPQRPEDEREWHRNVALVVILAKILAKQSPQVLGLLSEVTREMAGSVGIKKTISEVLAVDRLGDEESPAAIAKILNEELATGPPRTKYIVARALGLLMREPKLSDKAGLHTKHQAALYARLIDPEGLLNCLFVYPTVYEVYERVVQLRAPPESQTPGTQQVVDQLLGSGNAHLYLAYIVHIKKLPHCPFVPRGLVVKLLQLASTSPFHAPVVDEILATNLRAILNGPVRPDNAPLVCLVSDIVLASDHGLAAIVPDTCRTVSEHKKGVAGHRALITDRPMLDWLEGQRALYSKSSTVK